MASATDGDSMDRTPHGWRWMMIAGLVIAFSLGVGTAASGQGNDCEPLRLGLPHDAESEPVRKEVLEALGDAWQASSECPPQVDIAYGSPYHLLEWFGRGALDVALLQDPALALLLRDHPERPLEEVVLPEERAARLRSPAPPVYWQASRTAAAQRIPRRVEFFESVVREAQREALRKPRQECSDEGAASEPSEPGDGFYVVASWHLDPGYLALLLRFEEWWQQHRPEDLSRRLAWSVLLRRTRFESPHMAASHPLAVDEEFAPWSAPVESVLIRDPIQRRLIAHSPAVADRLRVETLRAALIALPRGVQQLIESPPEPLRSTFEVTTAFGVRTFSFTLAESLDLLREDQSRSLALVLPGGGVKAAYQSRLVDALYGSGHLHNAEVPPPQPSSLRVDTVVGTSGGALLGYFVARLNEQGPWTLADLLWRVPKGSGLQTVKSADIFPGGDLLRYASVLVVFLVLSSILLLFTIPVRGPFHPRERRAAKPPWRTRLTFGAAWFLFAIPLIVRKVHGAELREHIPEIEGMIYALATFLAISADQILVRTAGKTLPAPDRRRLLPAALLALGAVLIGVPLWFAPGSDPAGGAAGQWLQREAPFDLSFVALYLMFLLVGIWLVRGQKTIRQATRPQLILGAVGVTSAPLLMLATFRWWASAFDLLGEAAMVFLGFFLVGLLLLATETLPGKLERPAEIITGFSYLLVVSVVILSLTQPEVARPERAQDLVDRLSDPSRLGLSIGALFGSLGAVLFFAGLIIAVHRTDQRYEVKQRGDFLAALAVSLGHVLLVYAVLIGLALFTGIPNLELTGVFWRRLLLVAVVSALLLVGIAVRWPQTYLARGLRFLASFHPNGVLVHRRLARFAGIALLALVWWNLIVAPAIYGNRRAHSYLKNAIVRFDEAPGQTPARLHAKFLAPTNNLLEGSSSTLFFLFSPDQAAVSPGDGSGAQWYSYGTDFTGIGSTGEGPSERADDCEILRKRSVLESVILASGSPFPIFPATQVTGLPCNPEPLWLIDGGFSSLVPVDAALNVGAEQILIVHSTHPQGHGTGEAGLLARLEGLPGDLARNLGRLPAHLFGVSQRVDQISRRESLVVSLAPPRWRTPWPPLFDFRQRTVDCLIHWAEEDQTERIGLVESWGQPKFRETQELPSRRPEDR